MQFWPCKKYQEFAKVAFQNPVVLDVASASEGGMCILGNTTCCTYADQSGHISTNIPIIKVKNLSQNWTNQVEHRHIGVATQFGGWFGNATRPILNWVIFVLLLFEIFIHQQNRLYVFCSPCSLWRVSGRGATSLAPSCDQ